MTVKKIAHCKACGREDVDGEHVKDWPRPGDEYDMCLLCGQITTYPPEHRAIIQALGVIYDEVRSQRRPKRRGAARGDRR